MEEIVAGRALLGPGLDPQPARVVVEDGRIRSIEEDSLADTDHFIVPAFFNAHTHLADTVAMDLPLDDDIAAIVAPPHGLKHRILRGTLHRDLVDAMHASIRTMIASGTRGCMDFREGGRAGVRALKEAASNLPVHVVILGREGGERIADGLGVSSARDVLDLDSLVQNVRNEGKMLAFHAGERDPGDIDRALEYDPDLLVHCTHASAAHLRACADRDIPIAVCPRANWAFGVSSGPGHPPIREMLRQGCEVLLGTDNVMAVQPDLLQEMSFLSRVYRIDPVTVLRSAVHGSVRFGRSHYLEEGNPARFLVIDIGGSNIRYTRNPIAAVVNRLHAGMIEANVKTMGTKP